MKAKYCIIFFAFFVIEFASITSVSAAYHFSDFRARPPIHIYGGVHKTPVGITPNEIKAVYHLPLDGGKGTIAIISAYDDISIEKDLAVFNKQFNLPSCTAKNNCFEKHLIKSGTKSNSGWALETTLDVEWAHAIAPRAKILLVEAETPSGLSLLNAVDYTAARIGVSIYEKQPVYQSAYSISKSNGMRAIPDVAYNADPKSGFPIVRLGTWRTVGGTSAGSPQWAAIAVLGRGVKLDHLYIAKASDNATHYFCDIVSGSNGDCIYYCNARRRYDYITGLGSPLTVNF